MVTFLLVAALMVAATLLMLLRPWQRGADEEAGVDARELSARLYREQLAELDRDLATGSLRPEDHAQACAELQRRLIDEVDGLPARTAVPAGRRTHAALALALPLLAAVLYAGLGTPEALAPQADAAHTAPVAQAPDTGRAQVDQMLSELAARAEQEPANPRHWAALARSYRLLGRLPEAARAFERMGPAVERSPALLVEYADVLGAVAGGQLEGRPLALVKRALEIDPQLVSGLSLYATAAFNRQDTALAISTWERALALAPPGSEDARWLTQVLTEARASAGVAASAPARLPR